MLLYTFIECLCCAKHYYQYHICNLIDVSKELLAVGIIIDILKIMKQKLSEVKWLAQFIELVSNRNLTPELKNLSEQRWWLRGVEYECLVLNSNFAISWLCNLGQTD